MGEPVCVQVAFGPRAIGEAALSTGIPVGVSAVAVCCVETASLMDLTMSSRTSRSGVEVGVAKGTVTAITEGVEVETVANVAEGVTVAVCKLAGEGMVV